MVGKGDNPSLFFRFSSSASQGSPQSGGKWGCPLSNPLLYLVKKMVVLVSIYLHLINSNETEFSALRNRVNSYSTNFVVAINKEWC